MKNAVQNIFKAGLITIGIMLISFVVLLLFGKLNVDTAKLVSGLNTMYTLPIIIGNLLLLESQSFLKQSKLIRTIMSIGLSMVILFAMNFILWILIWGAPIGDLFTERNLIFYLIGICLLIVTIPLFNFCYSKLNSKQPV